MTTPSTARSIATVEVALGDRAYPIHIGVGILDTLPEVIAASNTRGAIGIVTDSHVGALYGAQVQALAASTGRRCAPVVS